MSKSELIQAMAESADMSEKDASRALDAFIENTIKSLQNGDEVRIIGFGSFVVANSKATEGRNPRTGEKISIPATRVAKFKPSKELRDAVKKD